MSILNMYEYVRRRKKRGRPRKRGRPIITGKYAQKLSTSDKEIKRLVYNSERQWSKKRPRTNKDKLDVLHTCGNACYLHHPSTDFAVCPKCYHGQCMCYPDCDALLYVKRLANRHGYTDIEYAAQTLAEQLGCDWSTAIAHLLQQNYPKTLSLFD